MAWAYRKTNEDGCRVESWVADQNLMLIHVSNLSCIIKSGRWPKGHNPRSGVCDGLHQHNERQRNRQCNTQFTAQAHNLKILSAIRPMKTFQKTFQFQQKKTKKNSRRQPGIAFPPKFTPVLPE